MHFCTIDVNNRKYNLNIKKTNEAKIQKKLQPSELFTGNSFVQCQI